MPLHLLGKKSWNVYNPENIARVRKDEAAAHAEDEERERQLRSNEAETRLNLLKGGTDFVSPQNIPNDEPEPTSHGSRKDPSHKRRRLNGEDDTDRDIRLAMVDTKGASQEPRANTLFDSEGHIDLVQERSRKTKPRDGSETQNEAVGMRFSDAAGYRSKGQPWYANNSQTRRSDATIDKDVWGNDDPRRQEREQQRIATNDPLAAMRKGVKQLRENEKQRKEWIEQRERDLYEVERLASQSKRKARSKSDEEGSLDGFSLDAPYQGHARLKNKITESEKDSSHRRHRRMHRSSNHERRRHHHHHRTTSSKES